MQTPPSSTHRRGRCWRSSPVDTDQLVGYEWAMTTGSGRGWALLLALALCCSCSGSGALSEAESETVADELSLRIDLSVWKRLHVGPRRKLRLVVQLEAGTRYVARVTDHWGWPSDRPRPSPTLDVDIRVPRGASLTGVVHNRSQDANGTLPDPIPFVAPAPGRVEIDVRELDGVGGDFELRLDREPAGEPPRATAPPDGVVVHQVGPVNDLVTVTSPAVLLAGGGPDHDAATSALVRAGGQGDAVILRMDDTGGAYATYFVQRGAHAATEIAFDPDGGNADVDGAALATLRARADDPWVAQRIDAAEILFFAGGNQTKYVDAWRGTVLAAAVDRLVIRRGAIGGTSAGMHVLGGIVHTPRGAGDSVTSADALADPYLAESERSGSRSLELAPSPFVLPVLRDLVMDTHWTQRGRLGRSLTFLARVLTDELRPLGSIALLACDEGVAVLVDGSGRGRVFAPAAGGAAFLFRPEVVPDRCADDRTLDWRAGVPFVRIEGTMAGDATLDLRGPVGPGRAKVVDGVASAP